MKRVVLFVPLFLLFVFAQAQTLGTMRGFAAGGATDPATGTQGMLGVPFYRHVAGSGLTLSEGLSVAHLVVKELTDETCENTPYQKHYFDIPTSELTPGVSYFEHYEPNVEEFDYYDLLNKLTLTVKDAYEIYDSIMYHADALPVIPGSQLATGIDYQVVLGDNDLHFLASGGCDSLVHLYVYQCPLKVSDINNNEYNTLILDDFYCWTKENLKAGSYAESDGAGGQTAAGDAPYLVYVSAAHPDAAANSALYGYLYTWNAATGTLNPAQGICPVGWHLPTAGEMALLHGHSTSDLNSTDLWVQPNNNTNSTGFTALPAGLYNPATGRFEGMLTTTGYWSPAASGANSAQAFVINYYCDEGGVVNTEKSKALSVRCVKDN